jgi:hypothetical protein
VTHVAMDRARIPPIEDGGLDFGASSVAEVERDLSDPVQRGITPGTARRVDRTCGSMSDVKAYGQRPVPMGDSDAEEPS